MEFSSATRTLGMDMHIKHFNGREQKNLLSTHIISWIYANMYQDHTYSLHINTYIPAAHTHDCTYTHVLA